MNEVDFLIVGQGLAGTALAWWLHWRGASLAIIDEDLPVSSSKIAAGLITPITGKRLARSWRFLPLWETAIPFYHRVQQEMGASFLIEIPTVRLLGDQEEIALYEEKRETFYRGIDVQQIDWNDATIAPDVRSALVMSQAGRLKTFPYLTQSREFFSKHHQVISCRFQNRSMNVTANHLIEIPALGIKARWLIIATGAEQRHSPLFPSLQFRPAKGQILTLQLPEWHEERVIHRGFWIAPEEQEKGIVRVGATYEWDLLDKVATDDGHQELLALYESVCRSPKTVLNHQAAIRPVMKDNFPVAGVESNGLPIALLNGLGSKGSLQAPWCAKQLVDHVCDGLPLDREIDYQARRSQRP